MIGGGLGAQAQQLTPVVGHDQKGLTAIRIGLGYGLADKLGQPLPADLGGD